MLQLDPAHRPSIPEVLAHPWMKGTMPSYDEILKEFTERDLKVKDAMEAERAAKEEEKLRQVEHRRKNAMRSGGQGQAAEAQFNNDEDSLFKPSKTLEAYEKIFSNATEFFSTYNPDMIEEAILDFLR